MSSAPVTPPTAARRAWVEQLMGMPVSIHLRGEGSRDGEADSRVQAAYDELRAVDVLFSTYRADSQVSRIDRGELVVADAHHLVREVVDLCETARTLTGGAFDAWRPDPARPNSGRHFDPTGLVKGWAVQRVSDHLVAGLGWDVVVNAGGDVAARTGGADPKPWRVGIEDPVDPTRVVIVLPLVTGGVATSGTARRGAHLVDPADGAPVTDVLSVTVTGPSLLWADVLATAAFVRGAGALAVVEAVPGYDALVIAADGTRTATEGLVQLPVT